MSTYWPKEFFKIMQNHELQNGELRLPKKFVKKHWEGISNPVVLKLPNGDQHKISWVKRDGDIWLQKNWENIAKFLKFGYAVVFKYIEKIRRSYFKVKIFGLNTLEIDYSTIPMFIDESCEAQEIVDDDDDSDTSLDDEMSGTNSLDDDDSDEMSESDDVGTSQRRKNGKRKMNGSKRGNMIKKAKKCSTSGAVNVNPSFEVKLSKSYALPNGDTLYIESEFLDGHRELHNKDVELKMGIKSWFVTVKFYGKTIRFYKGWRKFKKGCKLKNGDIIFLELIDEEQFVFEVSFE
ncbi:hypothetical protein TSUD_367480 [Trifolium subterraneum]|uniref:TF-B3 domain-containing protein n=1 Tax=Trifolium subterraneum TaxID=3900 RepID=A0A2Z6NIY6_TRISU|nr:hypothetical protein TSUD_367480 [Trifolium subterraneum]